MNKFNRITPMLWTDKLSDTIVFYKNTLGFTVNESNEYWRWADLSKDGANIMLAKPNDHEGFKNGDKFTGSFYIGVDDADKLWNELKDKTKVCYAIDSFDWSLREFAIYDNNGYILQFGHEIKEN